MKRSTWHACLFLPILSGVFFLSCSKSGSAGGGLVPGGDSLFPLALQNNWNYKLKNYDTATGNIHDSSFFNLTVTSQLSENGVVYYQFQDPVDTTTVSTLANLNTTTVGSIDEVGGLSQFTLFVSGSGDSTASISSWPVNLSSGGTVCRGTNKLYGHYTDTTLVNNDGAIYDHCIKNVVLTYNCAGDKLYANVYFIQQGLGIVRFSKYIYNPAGAHLLQSAWVLESYTLH